MPIIEIHGKKVHVDDEHDHSIKHAIHYLEQHPENAHAFFKEAHDNHTTGVAHFDATKPAGYNGHTRFTLVHNSDGTYKMHPHEHHMF